VSDARPNTPPPDELAAIRAEMKRLETREAELRALLLAEPEVRTGANWLAEVKTVTQERTDLKELRAMHPALVEEYTFPVEIQRIVLMGIDQDTGEIVSARKMRATAGADQ
jgi:hypothetical protein